MSDLKWNEKTTNIILLLIFFLPLGLYYTWKNPNWSLEKKVIVFLILFFPVGIYLMFKNKIWSPKTRIIITLIIGVLLIVEVLTPPTFTPPPFDPKTVYTIENVDCNECYFSWYVKVVDENSGYFISVWDNRQGCKLNFTYTKEDENFNIYLEYNSHVSGNCSNQFGGVYKIEKGKWSNGNIFIGQTSSVVLW
jgi:hypothetical protein